MLLKPFHSFILHEFFWGAKTPTLSAGGGGYVSLLVLAPPPLSPPVPRPLVHMQEYKIEYQV